MRNFEAKLNIYFALLACVCGMLFFNVNELGALPVIACFFAIFGLVFVDLLKWFALPPTMAYLALGGIAFYSINRLITIGSISPEPQMIAVAELLVLVQAVLMLQRKSRRIYEQLAVFALLEMVVAAIFNNAISYGLLLIPLGIIAIGAMSLLHVYITSEDAFVRREPANAIVRVSSLESRKSFLAAASPLPWIGVLTIAPSVLAVAFVFFFALPRTSQASRGNTSGMAQVGFNDEVRLGQIGNMMLNPEIAVRIDINDRQTGGRYEVIGDFYLRGTVLEKYDPGQDRSGTWSQLYDDRVMLPRQLPATPIESASTESSSNDEVAVQLSVLPMKGSSLFSIPPYYYAISEPDIVHFSDRWTIGRSKRTLFGRASEISYRFVTNAFRDGIQTRFLPRFAENEGPRAVPASPGNLGTAVGEALERDSAQEDAEYLRVELESSAARYLKGCLEYDTDLVPSAERLAEAVIADSVRDKKNPVEIAEAMERFLSRSDRFRYSLDLSMERIIGLDPVEQFLSVDQRGNCQYFASALVLMLRSQGIPARLVVGFNTDEYNTIGRYYVARQLHAHAWVEALVDSKWIGKYATIDSSSSPGQYWMRLDPTPGGGGTTRSTGGRVSEVLDMAQEMWKSYVVDADATNRRRDLSAGNEGISGSYQLFYEWVELKIARVRAGELGAGALAGRELFSWPSAILGILVSLAAIIAYQFGVFRWVGRSKNPKSASEKLAMPSVAFFAEAVSLLERLGIRRHLGQTPKEFTTGAADLLQNEKSASLASPLTELTSAFYLERFSSDKAAFESETNGGRMERINAALNRVRERVDDEARSTLN
jgi:transglutaminase-like putative cysteine protease